MASNYTITPGYSHASGGLVTPARLNTAISGMVLKPTWTVVASNATAAANSFNRITANSVTLTLPASPADGDFVEVSRGSSSVSGASIGRNGKTIMGVAADLAIDVSNFSFRLTYSSAGGDWIIS